MMTIFLERIALLLPWRKRKSRSRLHRITNRTVTVLAILYLCVLFFPNFLFAHSVRVGQFDVHSDRPISNNIRSVFGDAQTLLAASPFNSDDQTFDIFIAEDNWRRCLLNPRAAKASGAYFSGTDNIILNRCDIDANLCFNGLPKFNTRPMHSVIAHECTHSMIRKRIGLIRAFLLPTWKHEGYCEYIAGNPSFDTKRAIALLAEDQSHPSITFRYACWLLAVRHVLDDRGLSVDELCSKTLDFQDTLDSAVQSAKNNIGEKQLAARSTSQSRER
jgi:hypothetical protein